MVDEARQVHPAFAGIEDSTLGRDRRCGEARDDVGNVAGEQVPRLVADSEFVPVGGVDLVAAVVRIPAASVR
jgi:hypothetical protein